MAFNLVGRINVDGNKEIALFLYPYSVFFSFFSCVLQETDLIAFGIG